MTDTPPHSTSTRTYAIATITLGFFLLAIATPYYGITGDLATYLLSSFANTDSNFAMRDWFIYETAHYHYTFQFIYTYLIRWNILPVTLFALHLIDFFLIAMVVYLWIRFFEKGYKVYFLALVPIILGIQVGWGTHWMISGNSGVPSHISAPLILWFWLLILQKRPFLLSLMFVLITYIHVNAGILGFLGGIPFFLGEWKGKDWNRRSLIALTLPIVFIIPLVLKVVSDFNLVGDSSEYLIYFYARMAHHVAPETWSKAQYLQGLFGFCMAWIAVLNTLRCKKSFIFWQLTYTVLFIAAYIFLTVWYWPFPVRMFLYRTYPLMLYVAGILLAIQCMTPELPQYRKSAAFFTLLANILYSMHIYAAVFAVLLGIIATFMTYRINMSPVIFKKLSFVLFCFAIVPSICDKARKHSGYNFNWSFEVIGSENFVALSQAIQKHTLPGSIISIPPNEVGFRITANRAIVVDYKCSPLNSHEIKQWRERLETVLGIKLLDIAELRKKESKWMGVYLDELYAQRTAKELFKAVQKYNASHIVVKVGSRFSETLPDLDTNKPIWRNVEYELYQSNMLRLE